MQYDLLKDISTLTTIPYNTLLRLSNKEMECMTHSIIEAMTNHDLSNSFDIGFGQLIVTIDNDSLQFKFVPSAAFETVLVNGISTMTSPLTEDVEQSLSSRVINTYKDLF